HQFGELLYFMRVYKLIGTGVGNAVLFLLAHLPRSLVAEFLHGHLPDLPGLGARGASLRMTSIRNSAGTPALSAASQCLRRLTEMAARLLEVGGSDSFQALTHSSSIRS